MTGDERVVCGGERAERVEFVAFHLFSFYVVPLVRTMTDRANIKDDMNKLKDFNKYWDGIPMKHFDKLWFLPFIMACGNIVMDGHSLKDTFDGVDPGGANGPAANAAQNQQRGVRNRRLFAVLMNYIDKDSSIFEELNDDYSDDGVAACTYIRQDDVGNIPLSPEEVNIMKKQWDNMTLENSAIALSAKCILEWANLVKTTAAKFPVPKSNLEMYNKFLEGLPSQLQIKVIDERENPNANFVFPAVFAAPHPQVGNAHPNAGEKDLRKVSAYFNRVWTNMISNGLVRIKESANKVDDEEAFWISKGKGKVPKGKGLGGRANGLGGRGNGTPVASKPTRQMNDKVCCYKCGGLGHVARTKCDDGSWLFCATQEQVDHAILNGIKYPHIPSAEERRAAAKAASIKAAQVEEEVAKQPEEAENDDEADAQFVASEAGDEYADY